MFWQASSELNSEGTAQTADIEGAKAKKSLNTDNSNHLLAKFQFFPLDFDDVQRYLAKRFAQSIKFPLKGVTHRAELYKIEFMLECLTHRY